MRLSLFIMIMLSYSSFCTDIHELLSIDFFTSKNVKYLCIFSCYKRYLSKEIIIYTMSADIRLAEVTITAHVREQQLEKCLTQKSASVGVSIDLNCDGVSNILETISQKMLFDERHVWLMVNNSPNSAFSKQPRNLSLDSYYNEGQTIESYTSLIPENTTRAVMNLNLSVNAEITLAVRKDTCSFILLEIYNFGKIQHGDHIFNQIGTWNTDEGLNIWNKDYKYVARWDFKNITFRAITVMSINIKEFKRDLLFEPIYTPGISQFTKISSKILDLIRETHNFSLNYTVVDRWVDSPAKNSNLAVTNSLYWRQQDISFTSMRLLSPWLEWMDPVLPHSSYLHTKFYYTIPETGVGEFENEFLRPFAKNVWISLLLSCVLCGGALFLSAYIEKNSSPGQFALFSVVATYCQQDFGDNASFESTKQSQAKKMALFTTGICSLLLYNYYTSSVVSWLLSAPPPSISSLEGLVESPLEIIFEDMGYARSWLEVPGYYFRKTKAYQEDLIRSKKVRTANRHLPLMQTLEDGIELVRKGGYAFHSEPYNANIQIAKTFNQAEICKLGSLDLLPKVDLYTVLQKKSPYKEFFQWSLMRIQESGHVSWARQQVLGVEPKCHSTVPRALALGGAAPAFLLLAIGGWLLGLVILILEIFHYRYNVIKGITPA